MSGDLLLTCERQRIEKRLHRGLAVAPATLVRPDLVVLTDPLIQIGLQRLERRIDLLAKRHAIKLIEHGFLETFADAIGLRMFHFRPRMFDVLDPEVQLVWSSQDLVEMPPARFVGRFELLRAEAAEVAVTSRSIVEGIDVISHLGDREISVLVDLLLDSLLLEAAEEELCDRVVPTIAFSAHARFASRR